MSLAAGTRLGHYEIERVLGAGGMGVVYRAFDSRLERTVAIKFLKQEGTADASHRLLSEARSASALNHPNICTIHEVAELGDQCFIVMEYVEGKPLSDVLLSGTPPLDRGLNMAVQVASALAHAHERGVVHGDLKAPNVLLSDREQIKVVDFGLARRQSTDEATVEVITGGTPYAMAPEQISGGRADARSDVWSFGVLLQELVSGTRPYTASTTAEYFAAIMRDAPTRPPASVAPGIRRTIERCLTREPSRRYQDGAQVLEALQELSGPNRVAKSASPVVTDWSIPLPPALATAAASQIVLIGRDAEWTELRSAWDRARTGRRQLTLLAGEPGIGKTRLITEFARGVGQEAIVLLGRCDQEALVPQQPFVEALEWYARACPPSALDEQLADIDGAWELAQLVAPLKRSTMAEPTDANAEGRRYRLFEAVATFISRIAAHRPLLLILEDLHWADRATVLLLRHLLRSSHEASLCIVGTYRETELNKSHPLSEVLADLRREGGVTRIALNGLGEDDVRQFIGQWIGRESPQTLTNLVAGNTEGNPFFVSEVLRHLRETGALDNVGAGGDAATPRTLDRLPEGIRETISRRLARLSEECNRVLTLASVIGREFSLPLLAAVSDLSEDRVLDLLDEALAARLLQDVPGVADRYTFTHALVRDTLYETLTPARRSRAHRHTAEVLDRLAASTARPLADLAHHYALAGTAADAEKAIACAMGAAQRAAKSFALEEAARFYGVALKALDLLPQDASVQQRRFDLYFKRGRAFGDLGLWAFARVELEAALPLADTELRRAEVLIELCKCTFWGLDTAAVRRYSQEAMALSESLGRDDLVAETLSWVSGVMNAEGDVPLAVDLDRKAMARVGGPTTFGLARAVISLYHMGLTDEAVTRGYQAVESANASQDPNFRTYALEQLAISLVAAGRYGEATRVFNDMREVGRRHGVLPMLARGIAMNGGMHISLGDYARGEEMALEARELARRIGFPPAFISAGIDLLTVFARTNSPGRADGLVDEVSKSVVAASGWHGWLWRLRLNQAKAELAIARGDWAEATTEATQCVVDSEARTRPKYIALGLTSRARAQHAAGAQLAASADAARALEVARTLGDPAVILRALCAQLTVDGTDAVREEARAYTQRIAEGIEDPSVRARFLASDLAVSSG